MVLANTHWSKNSYRLKKFLANEILANSFIFSLEDALTLTYSILFIGL